MGSLSSLQKSQFLEFIILIFHEKVEKLALEELPATLRFLEFFHFFPNFSTHFMPLISILAPKTMEE